MHKSFTDLLPCFFIVIAISIGVICTSSCQKKSHFASSISSSNKPISGSGNMSMSNKRERKSKSTPMKVFSSSGVKKAGLIPGASSNKRPKLNKSKGFSVFERSKKRRKTEMSLFPSGITNKYKLHESHVSDKKAARMLKKKAKLDSKNKKE